MYLYTVHTPEFYMRRCFELATQGLGQVAPNPLVGAVVVHQNAIIGEGFHAFYGGPHAEVNAINQVADKSLLADCTLYISLEPCAHQGKTPPCTDLILK
ncbi:MAG: bifunctional diaminohydroxyphosphoribosylaminopyrimidine deaminase/5-amino-6-(5-phosphoribosylamino)uracil reductase RibD, partial [Bacteroidia bacterium]